MIKPRWTIYVCPRCGATKLDGGNMVVHSRDCPGEFTTVELVPESELEDMRTELNKLVSALDRIDRIAQLDTDELQIAREALLALPPYLG